MPQAPPFRVCARAPLRIDFAGGGTDIPLFSAAHGGAAVAVALRLSVQVEVRPGGGTIRLRAEDRDRHVTLRTPADLVYDGRMDAPKAALNMLPVPGGIEILMRSDAPPGAGLGEHGALNVALLAALSECRNERSEATELAELAFQLDTEELERVAGRQDAYIAALGAAHELVFSEAAVRARALSLDAEGLNDLAEHLVVTYPGRPYAADAAARRAWEAFTGGESGIARALTALRDLAAPMAAALEALDWRRAGGLLDDAARHHATFDPVWSSPPMRRLTDAAREAGGWGIKPAGPRAGASLVILCPRERRPAVAQAVQAAGGVVLDSALSVAGVTVWREALPEP